MNPIAQKAFDCIIKATQDSVSGGGVLADGPSKAEGPFRLLWEPKDTNNNYLELADYFNRAELEQEYLTELNKDKFKFFDMMKPQLQNDTVAVIHRDIVMRYSGRIHRILEETGRRKNICKEKTGLIANMQNRVDKFLGTQAAGTP